MPHVGALGLVAANQVAQSPRVAATRWALTERGGPSHRRVLVGWHQAGRFGVASPVMQTSVTEVVSPTNIDVRWVSVPDGSVRTQCPPRP